MQQQPWEAGWQPAEGPPPMAERVESKQVLATTYNLWKNRQGEESIERNGQFFRVSPGAFNTIPSESNLGIGHGVPNPRT